MEDKKELIDALNNLEIKYIKEYNSLCPNDYNVQKGGNCTEYIIHKCDVFETNPIYNNEVIIYKNKEYDIFTLSKELNIGVNNIAYDLVLGKILINIILLIMTIYLFMVKVIQKMLL